MENTNAISQLATSITNFATSNSLSMVTALAVAGFVAAGIGMMLTKQTREWAKGHIMWIAVGAAVSLSAVALASQLISGFTF